MGCGNLGVRLLLKPPLIFIGEVLRPTDDLVDFMPMAYESAILEYIMTAFALYRTP